MEKANTMQEHKTPHSIKPHIIIIAVIVIVLLTILLWPSSDTPSSNEHKTPQQDAPESAEVVVSPADEIFPETQEVPLIEPDIFESIPSPEAVELDVGQPDEPQPEPEYVEPEPIPVDISDAAIESALVTIANNNTLVDLLVDDALLERFVVTIANLSNGEIAPNQRLLNPPEKAFRVYQQANRYWVDPASYKRYTPYVNAMESLESERLLTLFERYEGDMMNTFEQIAASNQTFNSVFIDAIDTLLDTPEVPVPVEVFTDSVTYKYKDERLENLNAPQKQLLRTGPDNMRRIKAKLREVKSLLEARVQ